MLSLFLRTLVAAGVVSSAFRILPANFQEDGTQVAEFDSFLNSPAAEQATLDIPSWFELDDEPSDRPKHPPGAPPKKDYGDKTLYQVISGSDKFKYLTKAINFSEEALAQLNDSSAKITFFAPPDSALRPPKKRHPHLDSDLLSLDVEQISNFDLAQVTSLIDNFEMYSDDDDDDDKKERRKKILKAIVRAVLSYHILPAHLDVASLGANTTHATNLTSSALLGGKALRIKFDPAGLIGHPSVNIFSKVIVQDIKAQNGHLHVVSKPLLPPPPAFQEAFLVPDAFATFTSAIQRVGLTDSLDIRFEDGALKGKNITTLFLPSNSAFAKLPPKLKLFLFSPFGGHVLKKLLQLHIVPDLVFHSDYVHNATFATKDNQLHPHPPPHPTPAKTVFSYAANLTTALTNFTLPVSVEKFQVTLPHLPSKKPAPNRLVTKLVVNGVPVGEKQRDIPALNGAVHVISRLLNPRRASGPHHGEDAFMFTTGGRAARRCHLIKDTKVETLEALEALDEAEEERDRLDWEDWEEWLIDWATQN